MKRLLGLRSASLSVLAVALLPSGGLHAVAPSPPPAPGLRPAPASTTTAPLRRAETIIEDYIKASGGRGAWGRHKSVRLKLEIEAKGMNLRGIEERYANSAGKFTSIISISGMGTFRHGSNGRIRWSQDPINGLRILTGLEDEEARIDSTWNADLHLKKLYQELRAVPAPSPAPVEGPQECIELTPKVGSPVIACFDAQTHLRSFQKGTRTSPQGAVPYTVVFKDWRTVQGLKAPFSEELTVGPLTLEGRTLEIVFGEKLPNKLFELPKAEAAPALKADVPPPSPARKGK